MKKIITTIPLFFLLCSINLTHAQVTEGLVGNFPFTNGSFSDISGYHDCVVSNIGDGNYSLTTDRFGNSNCAINFQGAIFNAGTNHRDITSEVSLSVWIKTDDDIEGNRFIITKYGYNATDIPMAGYSIVYNDSARFDCRDETWYQNTYMISNYSNTELNDGEWHHIVGLIKETDAELEIWVDGIKENSKKYDYNTIKLNNPTKNLCIAGSEQYSSTPTFKGVIDDIRIYNRALDSLEINQLFNAEDPLTGINEHNIDLCRIYPNPSNGYINIDLNSIKSENVKISVINLIGNKIYYDIIHNPGIEYVNLSGYPNGVYFVEIEFDNRTLYKKLILTSN